MQTRPVHNASPFAFLKNGGEMGELIRNYDWSTTSLGVPEQWPASLKTALTIALYSKFPYFLFWGDDLVCFYNDAFRPSLGNEGKHPWALGKNGAEVWEEIWPTIHPWLHQVKTTGEALWMEDQLVGFYRNGRMEDIYWTFSYSPIYNEEGRAEGICVTCVETTDRVLARERTEKMVAERTGELETARQSLLKSNQYLQSIINLLKEPLQVLEPVFEDGVIVDFRYRLTNAAYAAYANTTPDQLQGKKVGDVFPGYFQTTSFSNPVETFMTGVSKTFEIHYDKDGMDLYNQMSTTKLGDAVVVHFTDFTRLKLLQLELEKKIKELEQSNESLEQFAYAASHDLKEPIRKIHFYSDKLFQDYGHVFGEAGKHTFERIRLSAERMKGLVDDLLMYSQVSLRPKEWKEVDLNLVLQIVLSDLELALQEKGAKVLCQKLPRVRGHDRQLQQLFFNLISNSIKYSRVDTPPEIKIRYLGSSAERQRNNAGFNDTGEEVAHIEISDNGIGFAQEDAERIFQVFQRLHNNVQYKGTGVGLSIARKVVENHQGRIWATAKPGEGATFHVLLPAFGG